MSLRLTNSIATAEGRRTWAEYLEAGTERFSPLIPTLTQRRVVFLVDWPAEALESLALGLHHNLDFGILECSRLTSDIAERMDGLGITRVRVGSPSPADVDISQDVRPGRVSVMTSGTTGVLKTVEHRWETLNTLARVRDERPRFWFVPYQLGSYAWYQMMCLGLFSPGQDLFCGTPADLLGSFGEALKAGVTAVSSTPTFWRYAFLSLDEGLIRASRLDTITLGGEIVDQGILDQLSAAFPSASIRHIYASSEAGAAIVVTDGKAGFPASRLEDGTSHVGLKVENGKLFVRSAYTTAAATGNSESWVDTGDLVELRDDRVYFMGREGLNMINVGGMKAYPAEIEAQLMKHPRVVWAQVYGRRAPLMGTLPAANVVLREPADEPLHDEAELSAFARRNLPEHAVPRTWNFLRAIPLSPSLKSQGHRASGAYV